VRVAIQPSADQEDSRVGLHAVEVPVRRR
jgi:hypothetical protein